MTYFFFYFFLSIVPADSLQPAGFVSCGTIVFLALEIVGEHNRELFTQIINYSQALLGADKFKSAIFKWHFMWLRYFSFCFGFMWIKLVGKTRNACDCYEVLTISNKKKKWKKNERYVVVFSIRVFEVKIRIENVKIATCRVLFFESIEQNCFGWIT